MNRTFVRNLQQPGSLPIGQRPREADVPLNAVEHAFPRFAIGAIRGVDFRVTQMNRDFFERPGFAPGVHRHGHGSARTQSGEQKVVGSRPSVRAACGRGFVRTKKMRARVNLLRESRGASADNHASYFAFFHSPHRIE